MFTDLQIESYVKQPYKCPYCGRREIEGLFDFTGEMEFVYQTVYCFDCKNEWVETYVIHTIEPVGQALKETA